MTSSLFYASPEDIHPRLGTAELRGCEAEHISRSMRARKGDTLMIGDGLGSVYDAVLVDVNRNLVQASIGPAQKTVPEVPRITVLQAVGRPSGMDEVIETAAEAGIAAVVPLESERSFHGAYSKPYQRVNRWRRIGLEASKVARRAWPLAVEEFCEWPIGAEEVSAFDLCVMLWEEESGHGLKGVLPQEPPGCIGFIVGPEGGFSRAEASMLSVAGAIKAGMGPLVIRSRSAAAYAAMITRYHYGLLETGADREP